jgi:putative peptidoglycan lipid II flippase
MSREATAERLRPRLANGFFRILFFVLPAAAFLILFGDLVVRVVYQRSSSLKLFASGFHALQDTRTPMKLAAIAVTTGVGTAIALTFTIRSRLEAPYAAYAAIGIVLGGVLGSWLNLALLWRSLVSRIGRFFDQRALRATFRLVAATAAAAGTAAATRRVLLPYLSAEDFASSLLLLLAVAGAGAVPYLIIARRPPSVAIEAVRADA